MVQFLSVVVLGLARLPEEGERHALTGEARKEVRKEEEGPRPQGDGLRGEAHLPIRGWVLLNRYVIPSGTLMPARRGACHEDDLSMETLLPVEAPPGEARPESSAAQEAYVSGPPVCP